MQDKFEVAITGHCLIEDSVDGVILDKYNAIHPQNMARVFARALANEPNYSIYRIAFGNGGTFVDATGSVSFRTPNDGIFPDAALERSRLYNETYWEVIDESSPLLGTGSGADPTADGNLPGVRSYPVPNSIASSVVIKAVLNGNEPIEQQETSLVAPQLQSDFVFDELGLFSSGRPLTSTAGYQDVRVSKEVDPLTGATLLPRTAKTASDFVEITAPGTYEIQLTVDSIAIAPVVVTLTSSDLNPQNQITLGALATRINQQLLAVGAGATAVVTQPGLNTFGAIRFISNTVGNQSSVNINNPPQGVQFPSGNESLFNNIVSFESVQGPVSGQSAGNAEDPSNPQNEHERLLTHLIFHPLLKARDRTWTITYKLTIEMRRTGT